MESYDQKKPEIDAVGINVVLFRTLTSFLSTLKIILSIKLAWPSLMENSAKVTDFMDSASGDYLSVDCVFGALRGD